ncbi:MAG: hypothetical protein AUJ47_01105 [Candidatus Marinimicrobia bacterium CG1_02_48_14]|nr:MAG: hypothetical protein AUJ47_01105 [Candidatus Marinimicrobia bacterium CG1_02_48_14]
MVILLSIYPTKSFLKLRKTKTELSQPLPEATWIQFILRIELVLLLLILFLAILTANGMRF